MDKKIIFVILFLMFILPGCSKSKTQSSNSQTQSLEPKEVVEKYFKYYNEKDRKGILTTLTEWHNSPNMSWGFEDLEYIKINTITEDVNPAQKQGYVKNGRGSINGVKEENVIIYKVEYEAKYKNGGAGPWSSGKEISWFTLIRKDNKSPWLIDDSGQG